MATDNRQWVIWAYKLHGCAVCEKKPIQAGGELTMEELHCDHRDPTTKGAVKGSHTRQSYATTLAELAKCDVLCAECHKERHRNGRQAEGQIALFSGSGRWRYE